MRGLIVFCLGAVSLGVIAAEAPAYYGPVQGTILTGLLERNAFDFNPGTLTNCTRNDAGILVAYNCDVKASAKVSGSGGKSLTVSFDKVWIAYKRQQNGEWIHEYHFKTNYQESGRVPLATEAELILWNYELAPGDIKGSLSLKAYGVFGGIQATGAQR